MRGFFLLHTMFIATLPAAAGLILPAPTEVRVPANPCVVRVPANPGSIQSAAAVFPSTVLIAETDCDGVEIPPKAKLSSAAAAGAVTMFRFQTHQTYLHEQASASRRRRSPRCVPSSSRRSGLRRRSSRSCWPKRLGVRRPDQRRKLRWRSERQKSGRAPRRQATRQRWIARAPPLATSKHRPRCPSTRASTARRRSRTP